MRASCLILALLAAACEEQATGPAPDPEPAVLVGKEEWWTSATRLPSGRERILAPRELLALMAEGEGLGFDSDPDWWRARRMWVFERVLQLAPDDVEANAALGRRTLRSLEGFDKLWERMLAATVRSDAVDYLLERFEVPLQDGHAIFLGPDDLEVVTARMREAREHLDRLDNDPAYRSVRATLERVRNSVLGDYPFVYIEAQPFLIFYSARDLQRISGEDPDSEERRLEPLRQLYAKRLEERRAVYEGLLDDIREKYPTLAERRAGSGKVLLQWIFQDRSWYGDYVDRLPLRERPQYGYRCGFVHEATNWAYLWEPEPADGSDPDAVLAAEKRAEAQLRESAAYLAVRQLLWEWGKDPEDPLTNHLETSPDYWLKVGWPAWLAQRRVEHSPVGGILRASAAGGIELPRLIEVVERRSRLDPSGVIPNAPPGEGFTDLATALVGHLQDERYDSAFERYVLSQIEGTQRGIKWFEECFGVKGSKGWRELQKAVYAEVRKADPPK